MILLFNLDSINKELVTKIARKSYRISHLVAFLNLIMCVLKKCVCSINLRLEWIQSRTLIYSRSPGLYSGCLHCPKPIGSCYLWHKHGHLRYRLPSNSNH